MPTSPPSPPSSRLTLRRFGPIQAGFPSPAQGYEDEPLDLHDWLVPRPAATFFFRVRGHHLFDQGVRDGSVLVVDRSLTPRPGRLIVADYDGQRVACIAPTPGSAPGSASGPGSTPGTARSGGAAPGPSFEELKVWGVVTAVVTRLPG